jgi:hypothetical protein
MFPNLKSKMRFRCLNNEELKELDSELIQFLIVNNVYKEDWALMNQESPHKAKELIEMFSDIVLDKVYNKVSFLERQVPKQLCVCSLSDSIGEMITIEAIEDGVDLTKEDVVDECLLISPSKITIYHGKKTFKKAKADEVFLLLNHGFLVSSEERFKNVSQHIIQST